MPIAAKKIFKGDGGVLIIVAEPCFQFRTDYLRLVECFISFAKAKVVLSGMGLIPMKGSERSVK